MPLLDKSTNIKTTSNTIKLYLFPFGSEENLGSHAALEYNGQVIDYSSRGFAPHLRAKKECYIYEIDAQKAGIDPKKLEEAIQKRKKTIKGKNYNYLTENCADQVIAVLEEAGAKNISKTLGISIPMLDGVASLDDWAEKNGTLIQTPLHEKGRANLHHYLKGLAKGTAPTSIKYQEDREKIKNCIQAICNPADYKQKIKKDYDQACAKGSFSDKMAANKKYSEQYMLTMLPQEEIARQVKEILCEYPDNRYKQLLINNGQSLLISASYRDTLSETTKDYLQQAGFPAKSLGRTEKPQQTPSPKKHPSASPTINMYDHNSQKA